MVKPSIIGLLVAGLLPGATASATNLVVNGGFESPPDTTTYVWLAPDSTYMPGWTVIDQVVQLTDDNAFGALGVVGSEGDQFMDLTGNVGQGGGVRSDAIATTIGTQYTLAFDLGAFFVAGQGPYGTAAVDVRLNDVSYGRFTNVLDLVTAGSDWVTQTILFTASTSTLVIDIRGAIGDEYTNLALGLDDVRLTAMEPNPVPEPGVLALMGLGLAGLGLSRRLRR